MAEVSNTICSKPANPWEEAVCGISVLGPVITGGICAATGNCQDAVSGVTTPPPGQGQQPLQQSGNNNLLLYGGLGLGGLLLLVVLLKVL